MATCCVTGCHKDHRKDRTYFNFPRKDYELAGKWWGFCDDLEIDPTWDQYICDLHFQESDFTVVDGKRIKKHAALPSIKGEELTNKMKILGLTQSNASEQNNSKRSQLNEEEKFELSGEDNYNYGFVNIQSCENQVETLPTESANVPKIRCPVISNPQLKNLKFTFDRQVVYVNTKERDQKYVIKSKKKKSSTHNVAKDSTKEKITKKQINVNSSTKICGFTLNESPVKKKSRVSSETLLRRTPRPILPKPEVETMLSVHDRIPSFIVKKVDERISSTPVVIHKPLKEGPQKCNVSSLNPSESAISRSILIPSNSAKSRSIPIPSNSALGKSPGHALFKPGIVKDVVPSQSLKNINEKTSLASKGIESSISSQKFTVTSLDSTSKKLPLLSSLIPHVTDEKLTMISSDSNIEVPRNSFIPPNTSKELPKTMFSNFFSRKCSLSSITSRELPTTVFSNPNPVEIHTNNSKARRSSKKTKKDLPKIKIKKRKFNNLIRELEIINHHQRCTLAKTYQRSSQKPVDLSDPKFSIAATAKSLDKHHTASDNSLEKIDLERGEWDKLFIPGKTIFSPTTMKSDTSGIVHHLRHRLPNLNDRDKMEVRFLLNMMSMYPQAPEHMKKELVERLNLVYVATLFKWETAISLAVDNVPITHLN